MMFLLDTNVLSELMRPSPEPRVLRWMDARPEGEFWISAVTAAEILLGIELLPPGKRRDGLADLALGMFRDDFSEKCLPFDQGAAGIYAAIVSTRMRRGRPICVEDAQIAAIALSGGLTLATRNTRDFSHIDQLQVESPWGYEG